MPTIDIILTDLQELIGKKLQIKAVEELLESAKAGLESYDEKTGVLRIKLEDTNQIYLWSSEGIARIFKGLLGIETGLPKITAKKSKDIIHVEVGVLGVRPCIAAVHVVGAPITDNFIKQLVQFQEKIAEHYGRKRQKISVGLYSYNKITWPITYKAVNPDTSRFIPLEMDCEMTLSEILLLHPTGQKYANILTGKKSFPLLVDHVGQVLSFPPIINSNHLGKIREGDTSLLVEVTGMDPASTDFVCTVFAYAFNERGWSIHEVHIKDKKPHSTPLLNPQEMKFDETLVKQMLGITLTTSQIKQYLERYRYGYAKGKVLIPPYRADVMHPVDIVEDLGICYGYNNIPATPITSFTPGTIKEDIKFGNTLREILAGMGYQEVLSAVLSNPDLLATKMELPSADIIHIKEYMSFSYSVVRNWIIPLLLDTLSQNKHNTYPQNIFEEGEVARIQNSKIQESRHLGLVLCDHTMDFTRGKQTVEAMIRAIGLDLNTTSTVHSSFANGRVADLLVNNIKIGIVGEIHPMVLERFEIRMPVVACEIDLHELMRAIQG